MGNVTADHASPGLTLAGVVAIIRLHTHVPDDAIANALIDGGVRVLEVTLPTPGALDAIRRWSTQVGVLVGAGTVRMAPRCDRSQGLPDLRGGRRRLPASGPRAAR